MIPVAILLFLIGAVLAWGFRVWILVPISLVAMIAPVLVELALGAGLSVAFGYGLLVGLAPQLGYGFGLFAQNTLVVLRSPRSSRGAAVAMLYKRRSIDQTH
jgi:hypothetical protein